MSLAKTICIINGPLTPNKAIAELLLQMPVWAFGTPERQQLHSLGHDLTLDTYKVSSDEDSLSGMWRMIFDHYPYTEQILLKEFDRTALTILEGWNFTLLNNGFRQVPSEWLPDWAN